MKTKFLLPAALLLDAVLAAGIIAGDYFYMYRLPRAGSPESEATVCVDTSPLKTKFADRFSETVISTDTIYQSPNLSINITHVSYDSGVKDPSENGKHLKYGTNIQYTLADIYAADVTSLRTGFAEDTYGIGFEEKLTDMSVRLGSVLAVNGDSYSNNRHQDNGTIIRNGVVYRAKASREEICVLYQDGSLEIYTPEEFSADEAVKNGAWQSWVFGPGLLDKNGKAKTNFLTWNYISQSHPRTAIGYYEPGHYCLLTVDGRQPGVSRGMYLEEMAALFESLGCKAAYNLDGGHCSFMTKDGTVISQPYKPEKAVSDGIFICEPE